MPFCSSESGVQVGAGDEPTSWARSRRAVCGAQRFGIVIVVTASSGIDS